MNPSFRYHRGWSWGLLAQGATALFEPWFAERREPRRPAVVVLNVEAVKVAKTHPPRASATKAAQNLAPTVSQRSRPVGGRLVGHEVSIIPKIEAKTPVNNAVSVPGIPWGTSLDSFQINRKAVTEELASSAPISLELAPHKNGGSLQVTIIALVEGGRVPGSYVFVIGGEPADLLNHAEKTMFMGKGRGDRKFMAGAAQVAGWEIRLEFTIVSTDGYDEFKSCRKRLVGCENVQSASLGPVFLVDERGRVTVTRAVRKVASIAAQRFRPVGGTLVGNDVSVIFKNEDKIPLGNAVSVPGLPWGRSPGSFQSVRKAVTEELANSAPISLELVPHKNGGFSKLTIIALVAGGRVPRGPVFVIGGEPGDFLYHAETTMFTGRGRGDRKFMAGTVKVAGWDIRLEFSIVSSHVDGYEDFKRPRRMLMGCENGHSPSLDQPVFAGVVELTRKKREFLLRDISLTSPAEYIERQHTALSEVKDATPKLLESDPKDFKFSSPPGSFKITTDCLDTEATGHVAAAAEPCAALDRGKFDSEPQSQISQAASLEKQTSYHSNSEDAVASAPLQQSDIFITGTESSQRVVRTIAATFGGLGEAASKINFLLKESKERKHNWDFSVPAAFRSFNLAAGVLKRLQGVIDLPAVCSGDLEQHVNRLSRLSSSVAVPVYLVHAPQEVLAAELEEVWGDDLAGLQDALPFKVNGRTLRIFTKFFKMLADNATEVATTLESSVTGKTPAWEAMEVASRLCYQVACLLWHDTKLALEGGMVADFGWKAPTLLAPLRYLSGEDRVFDQIAAELALTWGDAVSIVY
ncbi:hypothetical protein HDU96_004635 [Phlyctochytrium bullatum]|nr:hypothetical protein HDU96_004635 [Phlyctochytrium bullatum]